MKGNRRQRWLAGLFCFFLGTMAMLYLLLPRNAFSPWERRQLAVLPTSWDASKWESYLADHLPLRQFFLGVGAYARLLTGQMEAGEILFRAGYLAEAPLRWEATRVQDNLACVNQFAASVGIPVDLMVVPSAGAALELREDYADAEYIRRIHALSITNPVEADLQGEGMYYRTDHHWTSRGAYTACAQYFAFLSRSLPPPEAFAVEAFPGFRGTTYARSCLWLTPAESIELWQGTALQRADGGAVFDREALAGEDKYSVFLGGNHPLITLINPRGQGHLVVVRDSYGSCLAPFLAEGYGKVTLVDLRYYKKPVSQLCGDADRVLVVYSLKNFMTDPNFPFLQ